MGSVGALLTLGGVVGIGVMEGIGIGVLFSLIFVLKALAFPDDTLLGQVGPEDFRDRRRHPEAKAIPGVIVYRFSGLLFFANCGVFRSRAEAFIEKSPKPLHGFVLDASAIFDVDLAACVIFPSFILSSEYGLHSRYRCTILSFRFFKLTKSEFWSMEQTA